MDQLHTQLIWQRSKKCSTGGCVEIAPYAGLYLVRDSKQTASPILSFGHARWSEFISALKNNELGGV